MNASDVFEYDWTPLGSGIIRAYIMPFGKNPNV
jgi:hypothetical protein